MTWSELTRAELDAIWRRVDTELEFRPSVDHWPGIREPAPFITVSLRDASPEVIAELSVLALALFRAVTPVTHAIYALDWQHASYRFQPHAHPLDAAWPVSVYPDGDYYMFFPDEAPGPLRWGWFGHPWEQTICLFGAPLLAALPSPSPRLLARVLRRG